MKGVFVMNTSLHDILFMILDNELRRHYQEIAVKQGLCQVTNSDSSSTQLNSTENYGRRCLTPLSPHRNYILS